MVRFRFTRADLLRTRYAVSPLFEAVTGFLLLRRAAGAGLHAPWVERTRRQVVPSDLPVLDALLPSGGYVPDFLSPPPASHAPAVDEELERVLRTPPDRVREELERRFAGAPPAAARALLEEPARGLRTLVDELRRLWDGALAPVWDDLRQVCADDIAHRAAALVADGPIAAFSDLGEEVRWEDDALLVGRPDATPIEVDLHGRGLQLVPSCLVWPAVVTVHDAPWQPTLIYPPRGVGGLWAPRPTSPAALSRLLGARRAEVLGAAGRERTTTGLARELDASPASISGHLAVLRSAGLVRARRDGREVHYVRTPAGEALVQAAGDAPGRPTA